LNIALGWQKIQEDVRLVLDNSLVVAVVVVVLVFVIVIVGAFLSVKMKFFEGQSRWLKKGRI